MHKPGMYRRKTEPIFNISPIKSTASTVFAMHQYKVSYHAPKPLLASQYLNNKRVIFTKICKKNSCKLTSSQFLKKRSETHQSNLCLKHIQRRPSVVYANKEHSPLKLSRRPHETRRSKFSSNKVYHSTYSQSFYKELRIFFTATQNSMCSSSHHLMHSV
jgi:hypothetical protein